MANKEDIQYQLTEKGKELAEKAADNNIKKDEIQSSIDAELVKPESERKSAQLIRELKKVDKKIAGAKKLEKAKKAEFKKVKIDVTEGDELEAGLQRHGLGYKKARDIRKKSFGSLLAEQEGGLFQSLKKTLSLKTQAKMTGIKESFDPLNIAKKLTFGSNWAPAMLGKLTGRSKEDTGYFANAKMRTSHVGETATKIGSLEEENNLHNPLMQILTLMQKSNEDDTKRREQENQQKEILDAKRDKRHKELLDALSGKKTKVGKTKPIKDAPSDTSFTSIISDIVNTLGGLKTALSIFGTLGTIFVGGSIASWFAAAVTADPNFQKAFTKEGDPTGMLGAMAGDSAIAANIQNVAAQSKEEKASIDAKNAALKNLLADAPIETRLYQVGAREYLMQKKGLTESQVVDLMGPKLKGASELRKEEKETATKLESIKQKPVAQMSLEELKQVKDSIVQYGDPRYIIKKNPSQATSKELATAKQLDEIDAAIAVKESKSKSSTTSDTTNTTTPSAATVPSGTSSTAIPAVAEAPATSSALIGATNKNLDIKLEEKVKSSVPIVNNTTNNVSTTAKIKNQAKVQLPPVRNQEETFQRMILNSTRIV